MVARDVHDERLPGGGEGRGRLDAIGAADVVFANTGERSAGSRGRGACNFFALICTQNSCY